jgi:hypothetical protein
MHKSTNNGSTSTIGEILLYDVLRPPGLPLIPQFITVRLDICAAKARGSSTLATAFLIAFGIVFCGTCLHILFCRAFFLARYYSIDAMSVAFSNFIL